MSEDKKLNLLQRINEVRKAIKYIQKDKTVSTGQGGGYKAVTHDQVTAMCRAAMIEHGVVCYPYMIESAMNLPMVDVDGKQAKQSRYDATYDFTFCNVDDPQDKIVIRIQSHAMDNADKAPGKALSYAKKYALLKLFEIETGEDEESRYQKDEFPLELYIEKIRQTKDIESLKKAYAEAIGEATNAGDKESVKMIARVKDDHKATLLKAIT